MYPDPELCYREKGHVGAFILGGIGGKDLGDGIGYGFGLRGAGRIRDVLELGLVVARYMGDGTAYVVLPQVNLIAHDLDMPRAEVHLGGQVGLISRRHPGNGHRESLYIDGLAFGAQAGATIRFPPSFALRSELAWLHANEATTHKDNGYTYQYSSANMAQLDVTLCLTF